MVSSTYMSVAPGPVSEFRIRADDVPGAKHRKVSEYMWLWFVFQATFLTSRKNSSVNGVRRDSHLPGDPADYVQCTNPMPVPTHVLWQDHVCLVIVWPVSLGADFEAV